MVSNKYKKPPFCADSILLQQYALACNSINLTFTVRTPADPSARKFRFPEDHLRSPRKGSRVCLTCEYVRLRAGARLCVM